MKVVALIIVLCLLASCSWNDRIIGDNEQALASATAQEYAAGAAFVGQVVLEQGDEYIYADEGIEVRVLVADGVVSEVAVVEGTLPKMTAEECDAADGARKVSCTGIGMAVGMVNDEFCCA